MNLAYKVEDRPQAGKLIIFAFQQLLAILAATIAVPAIINSGAENAAMSQSAALFGAGVGTIVYLLFTKFKSPVFVGSSFAFIGSMLSAFAGAISAQLGYLGLIIGAVFAGLVYVIIAIIVKFAGVNWIKKLMPAVVIGPTVAIIGLSLAGNAVGDVLKYASAGNVMDTPKAWIGLVCGLVTLLTVCLCSVYGKKMLKLIPFVIGILAGYAVAAIFTGIGAATGNEMLKIIDFSQFQHMQWIPDFTFLEAIKGFGDLAEKPSYIATIAVAYIPVAFVVFAEHIADHTNLSSVIGTNLLEEPGLHRTLLGDGVGSMAGAFFGGCPNTTYGESIGCVAITGNASVITILVTACMCILASFLAPFVTLLATIPACVMGGVCISLYGFIAVSGLKMIQKVDLGDNRNLFTVSVILIAGIGGMALKIGEVTLTAVAVSLILGICVNILLNLKKSPEEKEAAPAEEADAVEEAPEAEAPAEDKQAE